MKNVNLLALNAADASIASTSSNAIDALTFIAASVHVVATGSPVGVAKIQISNDVPPSNNTAAAFLPTNWVDVSGLTVSVSAAGQFLIPKFDCAYRFIRVVYTKTSGTGAITAELNALAY